MWQDARYAMRLLIRAPGFALVAILTLALGIGANTAIFSVARSVLLAPLPFADPDRLVAIWHGYPPAMPRTAVSGAGLLRSAGAGGGRRWRGRQCERWIPRCRWSTRGRSTIGSDSRSAAGESPPG